MSNIPKVHEKVKIKKHKIVMDIKQSKIFTIVDKLKNKKKKNKKDKKK